MSMVRQASDVEHIGRMDNHYDQATGEWVTDWTRYESVLAAPRFAPIREHDFERWSAESAWALLMSLLHAVPADVVPLVGSGPLENLVNERGAEFIDHLEQDLPTQGRLRTAILNVNIERGALPASVERRLAAAAGPSFRFLEARSP